MLHKVVLEPIAKAKSPTTHLRPGFTITTGRCFGWFGAATEGSTSSSSETISALLGVAATASSFLYV